MDRPESTCWTVIRGAAAGNEADRDQFARRYAPVVRAYLAARWPNPALRQEIDDAAQEVFVECFRRDGVLDRVDSGRPGGFRAFLYGVARNVALRAETERARRRERLSADGSALERVADSEDSLSTVFDRAWARALVKEAARLQEEQARRAGEAALRRVKLLRLRFHESLPIREIAQRWNADAAVLHHEYARARQEFKAALAEVVAFHHPGSAREVERECAELLAMLG